MSAALPNLVLALHLAATLFMVGVIWFVQIVHYPLMSRIDREDVPGYERAHTARTAWVVGPPMLLEAATAVLLLWRTPAGVAQWQLWAGGALLVVIWVSTRFVQIPCHEKLCRTFDPAAHGNLVATNWVRTVAWSLRGVLVVLMSWNDSN